MARGFVSDNCSITVNAYHHKMTINHINIKQVCMH